MSDYTLKPCPFCGGQADIENIGSGEVEDEYFNMISCEECGASACFGDDSEPKTVLLANVIGELNCMSIIQIKKKRKDKK